MAYTPAFEHDIFLSYAHGDNRAWIDRFADRLSQELQTKVGAPVQIWLDKDSLLRSVDFRKEIPKELQSSGVFLFLPSPSYVASTYCVDVECRGFEQTLRDRQSRFSNLKLANSQFALRCPMLPVQNNEHYELLPGLTDIPFCDDRDTFPIGSPEFESRLRDLVGQLVTLLTLMRNDATPVFVHKGQPAEDVADAYKALTAELVGHGYRVLPDRRTNIREQLKSAALTVFLLGRSYDEDADALATSVALQNDKPWVVWTSPEALAVSEPNQLAFLADLRKGESRKRTELACAPAKLKEEVRALLKPDPIAQGSSEGKPRVYVVFNQRDQGEARNAGQITRHFRRQFQFDYANDRSIHTRRLSTSDGVLLVWGSADEEWCSREFAEIVQASGDKTLKALCVFDPKDEKQSTLGRIRTDFKNFRVAELFGPEFDPGPVEQYLMSIVRTSPAQDARL